MVRPDYRILKHSAKGTTWENHKYIKRIDGTYYYPDNYEGWRHLPSDDKEAEIEKLTEEEINNLAKEVIKGNFGNGQERKELLGNHYSEIQKRVNEILSGQVGSMKVSEVSNESIEKVEEISKKISEKTTKTSDSKVHSGVDMDKVLSVYRRKGT